MDASTWKIVILSRYLGDYQPAEHEGDATALKSSEDIKYDLEGMGDFRIEEISEELALRGYKVTIDEEGKPKWLMKKEYGNKKMIR